MQLIARFLFFVLLQCFIASNASAALTSRDLISGSGDELITFDSETSLEWLDVTFTTGLSLDECLAGVGACNTAVSIEGFRHAIESEISELFMNAGIFDLSGDPSLALVGAVQSLQVLVDTTLTGSQGSSHTLGFNADSSLAQGNPGISRLDVNDFGASAFVIGLAGSSSSSPDIGHWLIRPVPEPSAALLISLGLAGLGARRKTR